MKKKPVRPRVAADVATPPAKTNREPIPDTEIADLAYSFWQQRGADAGSPEEDWYRAVQELRSRRGTTLEAAPGEKTSSAAARELGLAAAETFR